MGRSKVVKHVHGWMDGWMDGKAVLSWEVKVEV
jgi:hypothetical protein